MAASDEDLDIADDQSQTEVQLGDIEGLWIVINAIHLMLDEGELDSVVAERRARRACNEFLGETI